MWNSATLAKLGEQRSTRYSESNNEYQREQIACPSSLSFSQLLPSLLGKKKKKENKRVTIPGGFSSPIRWAGGGRDARGWIVALTDVLYVVGFHATAVIFLLAWKPLDSSSSSSSSSTSSLASPWSSLVIVVPLLVGETRLPNRVGKKIIQLRLSK